LTGELAIFAKTVKLGYVKSVAINYAAELERIIDSFFSKFPEFSNLFLSES
jgi:hypothetical protein